MKLAVNKNIRKEIAYHLIFEVQHKLKTAGTYSFQSVVSVSNSRWPYLGVIE
jgi:hypothetical protein